jgi:hypothetical protein
VAPHARGEVVLEVEDAVLPANARAWRVTAREGRLLVAPDTARAPRRVAPARRLPRLAVAADRLGPILAGALPAGRAAEAGLIASSGGAEIVESWFRARPAFLYPMNAF